MVAVQRDDLLTHCPRPVLEVEVVRRLRLCATPSSSSGRRRPSDRALANRPLEHPAAALFFIGVLLGVRPILLPPWHRPPPVIRSW